MVRETSIEAYNQICQGSLLSEKRFEIYQCLFRHGPLTANEIFRRIMGRSGINQANVPARLNEMVKMGVVKELGTRVCSVTGRDVLLFDVTPRLPVEIRSKSKAQKKVEVIGMVEAIARTMVFHEQVEQMKEIVKRIRGI